MPGLQLSFDATQLAMRDARLHKDRLRSDAAAS
jgi:hypothetical protein